MAQGEPSQYEILQEAQSSRRMAFSPDGSMLATWKGIFSIRGQMTRDVTMERVVRFDGQEGGVSLGSPPVAVVWTANDTLLLYSAELRDCRSWHKYRWGPGTKRGRWST